MEQPSRSPSDSPCCGIRLGNEVANETPVDTEAPQVLVVELSRQWLNLRVRRSRENNRTGARDRQPMEVEEDEFCVNADNPVAVGPAWFTNLMVPWSDAGAEVVNGDEGVIEVGPLVEIFLISNDPVLRRQFASVEALSGPALTGSLALTACEVDPFRFIRR